MRFGPDWALRQPHGRAMSRATRSWHRRARRLAVLSPPAASAARAACGRPSPRCQDAARRPAPGSYRGPGRLSSCPRRGRTRKTRRRGRGAGWPGMDPGLKERQLAQGPAALPASAQPRRPRADSRQRPRSMPRWDATYAYGGHDSAACGRPLGAGSWRLTAIHSPHASSTRSGPRDCAGDGLVNPAAARGVIACGRRAAAARSSGRAPHRGTAVPRRAVARGGPPGDRRRCRRR